MARFVVTVRPGSGWDPAKSSRDQAGWDHHAAFMDALVDERVIAFGGPAGEGDKFVLIADAPDQATLQARLALDPWAPADLLRTVAIEPWTMWLGDDERIDGARGRPLHLVAYRPGPRWDPTKSRRDQLGWDAHAAFMDALVVQRVILLGGPLDERRALAVVQLDDPPAVRRHLSADPWYDDVLAIECIEPWTVWLARPSGG